MVCEIEHPKVTAPTHQLQRNFYRAAPVTANRKTEPGTGIRSGDSGGWTGYHHEGAPEGSPYRDHVLTYGNLS
ncbi:uncharacterized protein PG986_012820 [Apiospora aurea]|uniref:Uncharacterized protein n=1 Tax=Apiospora aurea TaxID=335848 RepID=A0ABR1Q144_9PEZI